MLQAIAILALASVPDLFGYGARGLGTASTLTATASAHEAVYYNPANLAFSERASFAVGFQWSDFYLSLDGRSREDPAVPATLIGFDVPLPLRGVLEDRLTIGFGFVLPVGSVLVADIPRPGEPRFVRIERRAETVSLMGALGIRVLDDLAFGAGFIALSELQGAIDVAPNETGRIGTEVEDALVADYALMLGASYRLPGWSFGLVFRDESAAEFDLPITADLGEDFPLEIPTLDISGTAQFDPRQLVAGASWRLIPSLVGSVSIAWENWSRYRNPIVYTAVPANFPPQPEPNFRDIFTARAGAEYFWDFLIFRGGFAFSPSPVRTDRPYVDSAKLIAAAGAGLRWDRFSADLALQGQFLLDGGAVLASALELGVSL